MFKSALVSFLIFWAMPIYSLEPDNISGHKSNRPILIADGATDADDGDDDGGIMSMIKSVLRGDLSFLKKLTQSSPPASMAPQGLDKTGRGENAALTPQEKNELEDIKRALNEENPQKTLDDLDAKQKRSHSDGGESNWDSEGRNQKEDFMVDQEMSEDFKARMSEIEDTMTSSAQPTRGLTPGDPAVLKNKTGPAQSQTTPELEKIPSAETIERQTHIPASQYFTPIPQIPNPGAGQNQDKEP